MLPPAGLATAAEEPGHVRSRRPRDPGSLEQLKESRLAADSPRADASRVVEDATSLAAAGTLSILSSFEGLSNTDNPFGVSPSDTNLAVGPAHVFETVNIVGRITDKTGGGPSTFTLRNFFQVDPTAVETDPRVIYDPASNRWFATILQFSNTASYVIIAVSTTSDPNGTFCRYRLGNPTSETFQMDFPRIGISDDKVVVTYNAFDLASPTFFGAGYFVLNKADLTGCLTSVTRVRVPPDPTRYAMEPSQALSSSSTLYMAMNDGVVVGGSAVKVFGVNGVPGVGPVTESSFAVTVNSWLTPPNAPQAGSGVTLDTNDESVITAVWRQGSLWIGGNEQCSPSGGGKAFLSCLRVIQIRTDLQTVQQDITFGSGGQDYYYYPALGVDGAGNLFVVFNASSATAFAGLRVSGRQVDDPPNTLVASTLLRAGGGAQTSSRMGDYNGAALDPADPTRLWVAGEYIKASGSANWGSFIGQLSFTSALPTLALVPNATVFSAGDTLQVDLIVSNLGSERPVDAYVGIALPPAAGPSLGCPLGDAIAFDSGGVARTLVIACASANPATFPRFVAGISLPGGLPTTVVPDFFSLLWPVTTPGQYIVFIALTTLDAFLDGTISPGDIIALALTVVTLSP